MLIYKKVEIPFDWSLHANGSFSVRSMYKHLINNGIRVTKEIWRAKLPLRIKIFMSHLKTGVVLKKDNLARRNWNGSKTYSFCRSVETIQHLFLECAYARSFLELNHL